MDFSIGRGGPVFFWKLADFGEKIEIRILGKKEENQPAAGGKK